jgi:hypothetical protein
MGDLMALPSYAVNFRGLPACPCLATWLPVYEAELQRRGTLSGPLRIFQLIGSATASANTHSAGGAFDITDLIGDTDVEVARQMGADASWTRTSAQGFTPHIHGVLTGCPHNGPAHYQIDAVRAGFNGLGHLGRGGRDDGPRPLSGRTWREGITWAQRQRQQEDDMADFTDWTPEAKKAFGEFIQSQVRATLIEVDTDGDGKLVATHLGAIVRDIVGDMNAVKKKIGA